MRTTIVVDGRVLCATCERDAECCGAVGLPARPDGCAPARAERECWQLGCELRGERNLREFATRVHPEGVAE